MGVAAVVTATCTPPEFATAAAQSASGHPTNVIQIVTFRFSPGQSAAATRIFEEQAVPLYRQNPHMLEFRAYREVESPTALDLVAISRFEGMAGMDRSNEALRALASDAGTSIGAIYGGISEFALGHTDEFVEIGAGQTLGSMDSERLVVLEYLDADGPVDADVSVALPTDVAELAGGVGGPMVISDGWSHFRMYGAASLGAVQAAAHLPGMATVGGDAPVARLERMVLALVDALSVR